MANRTTIRCSVCGCETAITNIPPGGKVFCLHCGRLITDSYQSGMEYQSGMDCQQTVNYQQNGNYQPDVNNQQTINYQQNVSFQQGVNNQQAVNYQQNVNFHQGVNSQQEMEFNLPPQQSPIPETVASSPQSPTDQSNVQQTNAPQPPRPSWMTEPFIRVNWKRIGYTIKTVIKGIGYVIKVTFRGICSFISKRWADFREGLRSESASSTAAPPQPGDRQNVQPPDAASQPQASEPELPFGYVDRRQARMQQSFSRNFADTGAIPVPPTAPNYSQQRIDQSFSNSFADSGAIPVPPSNPNYSQQRIDQSFTKSFQENDKKQA